MLLYVRAHSYYHCSNVVCECMCLYGSLFDFLQNAFCFHVISIVLKKYVGALIFVSIFFSFLTYTIFDFVRMSKWFILLLFLTMCLINYWIFFPYILILISILRAFLSYSWFLWQRNEIFFSTQETLEWNGQWRNNLGTRIYEKKIREKNKIRKTGVWVFSI